MNQKERMFANLPYKPWLDGLTEDRLANKKRIYEYNNLPPERWGEKTQLIKNILGKTGESVNIVGPFYCDYGYNIEVGENFFANFNFVVLDSAKVKIGANAQIAPNVAIYTAGHPIDTELRNTSCEYGIDVTIGDNCWIGGNTSIMPGVKIGSNVVIGGGSVVTKDVPDNVIAAGNPCRVIREIDDRDKEYYFKNRKYDVNLNEL
jgi:maltose O-acetyltransferase